MQRVSSQARAAELHSTDLQAELRHQQEVAEEGDAEIRRLQKVSHLAQPFESMTWQPAMQCRQHVFAFMHLFAERKAQQTVAGNNASCSVN